MKYWITTFQATGIALFAGAVIADPPKFNAVYWGGYGLSLSEPFSVVSKEVTMDAANLIGISMTIIAVIVFIGWKKGWVK